ncbi:uncharacterized protein [Littorina saxatilis]
MGLQQSKKYTVISDEDLSSKIREITNENKLCGYRTIHVGKTNSKGDCASAAVQDDAAQDEVAVAQRDLDDIAMHDADALVLQDDAEAQQRTTDATNGQRDVANVTVNTCIVVKYPDRHYPGVVTAVHANELQVRFLKPHATNAEVFLHPDIDDVQLVGNDMVVATHVTLIPRGRSCREWTVDGFKFS